MKQGIHPDYHEVVFMDSATGYKFLSGSTKTSEETIEWEDGNTYPLTCGSFQQEIRFHKLRLWITCQNLLLAS